ncbi:MAG: class I SAM-dependent methyltransferase family protein [Nanoarchaeota archaeon]|nr:class I SAM-dependent methyltransferase family protein [Nanoarchaeota archaeon]
MAFYIKLREKLERELPENELNLLPRRYQIVGKILLLKLKPGLLKRRKIIGAAILELLPYLQTVCLQKRISFAERKPEIEAIAGKKSFLALHRENGCLFEMDVSKSMFSKGNKAEKARLASLIKPGETVIDMFAGIGYWTIPVAKFTGAKKVFAIDINAEAADFLERNAFLNNVSMKVEILKGDCADFADKLENIADSIIMGCLFETEKFLPAALKMAKDGCIIHFHRNADMENIGRIKEKLAGIAEKSGCEIAFIDTARVKSYAPKIWHIVMDLKVRKKI